MPTTAPLSNAGGPAVGAVPQVQPFRFSTSLILQESTGLRASTLSHLAKFLRQVPLSCVYYHTHHFLLQHHYLTPEPTNDFAYWVRDVLGEDPLGERLASVDTMAYADLQALRHKLVQTIDAYLRKAPAVRLRFVSPGQEFHFIKSIHVIMPTSQTAATLAQFAAALERVSANSLYFHLFDARLRLGRPTNDFTVWLTDQLGLKALGEEIARLDLYTHTLDELRAVLLRLVRQAVNQQAPYA